MTDFAAGEFDAVIVPGGFGAAKNLCDFAVNGANCTVSIGPGDACGVSVCLCVCVVLQPHAVFCTSG